MKKSMRSGISEGLQNHLNDIFEAWISKASSMFRNTFEVSRTKFLLFQVYKRYNDGFS